MAAKYSFEALNLSHGGEEDRNSPLFPDPIMYATGAVLGGADPNERPPVSVNLNVKEPIPKHRRSQSTPDSIPIHHTNVMTTANNPAAATAAMAVPPTKDEPKPKRRYPKPQTPPMSKSARLREVEEFSPDNDMVWREALRRQHGAALERKNSNYRRNNADRHSINEGVIEDPFFIEQMRINEHVAATQALHRTTSRHSTQSSLSRGKEWAPARSPLQKLEGKLNDISKEEKRARVEEAIMLFNEAQKEKNQDTHSMKDDLLRSKTGSLRKKEMPARSSSYRDPRGSQRRPSSGHSTLAEEKEPVQRPTFSRRYSGGVASVHDEISDGIARDLGLSPNRDRNGRGVPNDGGAETHSLYDEQRYGLEPIILPQRSKTQYVAKTRNEPPPQFVEEREQFLLDPGMPSDDDRSSISAPDRRSTASPWRQHQRQIHTSRRPLPEPPMPGEKRSKSPYGIPTTPSLELQGKSDNSSSSRTFTDAGTNNLKPPSQDTFESQPSSRKGKQKFKVSFPDLPPPTPTPLQEWRHAPIGRLRISDLNLDGPERRYDGGSMRSTRSTRSRRSQTGRNPVLNLPKPSARRSVPCNPPLYIDCGPMLKFNGIKEETFDGVNGPEIKEVWRGSMMIVTRDSLSTYFPAPVMRIFSQPMDLPDPPPSEINSELPPEYVDPVSGTWKLDNDGKLLFVKPIDHLPEGKDLSEVDGENGLFESSPSMVENANGQTYPSSQPVASRIRERDGEYLGKYKDIVGIRLYVDPVHDLTFWRFGFEIELGSKAERIGYRINGCSALGFWVPAKGQMMNIMFHSGNGFALSVDRDKMNGPDPMWRDALNTHQMTPFNVMIGGGDQIYNDAAMFETGHFRDWISLRCSPEQMAHPFNSDIKDELEEFFLYNYLRCFALGLFSVAVSHIPMVNMWNDHDITSGFGSYHHTFMKTHIFAGFGTLAFKYYLLFQHQCVIEETPANEPSWILGAYPGQYIKEKSRSVFINLGAGVKMLALDCRTERSRDDVLSDTTYQRIWNRLHNEVAKGTMKHLLVVSALPVAYPRLVWLQKFLTSKVADGAKSIFGKFSDKFEVDMSTLDSQWTSHTHKQERSWLVEDMQEFAACKSVRVTILSGDVRMAGVGRFYSNPELQISKENDYRYMLNIISSSIVDEPTAQMMADALNQRNKVHEFDLRTKEDLCPAFSQDVDGKSKANKKLFPRRNWCSIKQWQPDPEPPRTRTPSPDRKERRGRGRVKRSMSVSRVSASVGRLARRLSRGPPAERGSSPSSQKRMSQDSLPISIQRSSSLLSRNQSEETIRARGRSSVLSRHRNNSTREFKGGWADVHNVQSMEGGLDITIHCECNPRDPSGITTPYRILVPILDYDGPFEPSVHREKKKAWWKIKRAQKQEDKKEEDDEDEDEEEDEEEEMGIEDDYEHANEPELSDSDEEEEHAELAQQISHTDSVNRSLAESMGLVIPNQAQSATIYKEENRSPIVAKPAALFVNLDGAADSPTIKSTEGDSLSRFSSASQTVHGSQNSSESTGGLVKGDGSVKRRKKFLGVF